MIPNTEEYREAVFVDNLFNEGVGGLAAICPACSKSWFPVFRLPTPKHFVCPFCKVKSLRKAVFKFTRVV